MTSSFEDVYRIQTERIMELEREKAALMAVIEKCKIALDKHEDGCKCWIDAHVAAKEAIRKAGINAAIEKEREL
jgi:hypothetical protein